MFASVALDPSFGVGGLVTTDITAGTPGSSSPTAYDDHLGDLLRQPDGRIVVAGKGGVDGSDFALVRYLADGTLDPEFGENGQVLTDFSGTSDWGRAVALQDDGKIIVAGHASLNWIFDFGIARYNPDGSLDTSFGVDGKAVLDFAGREERVADVVLQADGKIVVAGTSRERQGDYPESVALARFNPDGSLDATFGSEGKLLEAAGSNSERVKSILVQPDGKLVVSGDHRDSSGTVAFLWRYNSDGGLDETFGDGGQVFTLPHGNGRNVLLQPDGKLLQVGSSQSGLSMTRYHADGAIDSSFGDGGELTYYGYGDAHAAALLDDGRFVVSLLILRDGEWVTTLRRFNADGSTDPTFDQLTLEFEGTDQAILVSDDGKLLVGGDVRNATRDLALAQVVLYGTPSFTIGASQQVDQNVGVQLIEDWAVNISPGTNGGSVTFEIVSNTNPGLFSQSPALSSSGTLSYQPAVDAWGEAVLTVRAVNEAGEASPEQSFRIIVEQVENRAPVLDPTVLHWLPKVHHTDANPPGSDLTSLLQGVTDLDSGDSLGVALTKADSIFGTWEVQLPGDTAWQALGEVSETSARLLPSNAQLRFVPQHEVSHLHTLEYRAWDQTQGVAGGSMDLTGKTGGSNAFSTAQGIAALDVFRPRPAEGAQPPEFFTARIATVTEHGPAALLAPDMVMTDADSTSYGPHAMLSFYIDYDGNAVGLRHTGTGPGQIGRGAYEPYDYGRSVADVTYGGRPMGSLILYSNGRMDVYLYNGATVEAVQALLRNVTVRASGDEVVTGTGTVRVYFTEDRFIQLSSESVSSSTPILVNRIGLNDPPELTVTAGGGSYVAGDPALKLLNEFSISDPDPYGQRYLSSTITVSITENGADADRLTLLDTGLFRVVDSRLYRAQRSVGTVSGGVAGQPLVIQFDEGNWVEWAEVADVLKHLAFSTAADADTSEPRQIQVLFADGQGAEAEPALLTVEVVAPTAPVLDTALSPTLRPVREDALDPASTQIAALLQNAVSDPQDDALQGIALATASNYHGVWQYRLGNAAPWLPVGEISESAALLLPGWARLRFLPKAEFHGEAKIYYRAWDQTQGSPGERFDLRGNTGGTNAFSFAKETATLTVTPVNDPPQLSLSGSVGYVHDKPAITLAPFARVADIDSANFAGGRLRVWITDGLSLSNRLAIGSGFTVDADNNVLQGTTIIGKRVSSGFGTKELVITFNTSATKAIVQQLARTITFKTIGGAAGQRKVLFTISDGDGGSSDEAIKLVNVS